MKVLGLTLALAVVAGLFTMPCAIATTRPAVDDQPHMQEALEALKQARHHLEAAIPDKDGHRTAAIKACDEAIKQTEKGIKYVNEHDHDRDHDHK